MPIIKYTPWGLICSGLAVLALAAPTGEVLAGAAVAPPREFNARYDARVLIVSGSVTWRLKEFGNGESEFEANVQAGGMWKAFFPGTLDELSRFRLEDGRPRTIEYRSHNGFGSHDRDGQYKVDWATRQVTGRYRNKDVSLPFEDGTVDRALMQLVLMYDLARDARPKDYTVLDRDKISRLALSYGPQQSLRVPAGRFDTILVTHKSDDGEDETRLWCAPALRFLPVQIEQYRKGSRQFLARLAEVNGLR